MKRLNQKELLEQFDGLKKVHCENCKYYGWSNIDKCFDGLPESFLGLTTRGWTNKDDNCPHYKRKWWKIWVA